MNTAEPPPRTLAEFGEYSQVALALCESARQKLVIYDHDLEKTGLESRAGIAALEALCIRSGATDGIRILVRSPRFIERDCPRLQQLLQDFGHRIVVKVVRKGEATSDQPFIVDDNTAYVVRFHHDGPRGKAHSADSLVANRLLAQFETMWQNATNGPNGAKLGL